ncbi:unnamed protein product [Chondrus crispus]|uniref:Uncharacterized protein n=1 Tax=Chondrus crispus TaxID=2769 RepID=R7QS50_CHOCR|nr:unnamed protein product [Chondrus crispus]CDF40341.1 unnamed protein product [Chondrus crispus]|eukprot:XP_005710634.1 unnamed protein product [Chondrus crispus]
MTRLASVYGPRRTSERRLGYGMAAGRCGSGMRGGVRSGGGGDGAGRAGAGG